ncbi:adenosylcobinamide-GDP ribazoletransferase [Aureimonas endophytica]|uniref:Adenosylcobinamide-GDP ribazoletransferase n=1 Tax=Aureimonas endophytica TaxID=2027858 RepID=A0A917E9V8_9HYPH|nr:adenosylcobinamide-GDP ribazoletransferase [Aureimonas endophytica]GGE17146.1 adenosylcobinamide-GDP ribazoletransferase [Aureimonas endophytica]
MQTLVSATFRALAFLSRLPAPAGAFRESPPLGRDAYAFPLAGLVIALPSAALLLAAAALGLSPASAAILALGLLVGTTGALHEDGLADVADGLGGNRPKERALEIMKDSRIGAYGALALGLSLLLRASLLADLAARGPGRAALALLLAAAASRGLMAWLWADLPPAVPGGTADRAGRPSPRAGRQAAALGTAILLLGGLPGFGLGGGLCALGLALAGLAGFRALLRRRLGGQTGDCLGAAQQIAEMAILIGLALTVRSA